MLTAIIVSMRLARAAALCLLCWCCVGSAAALEVLIIPDQDGGGVDALAANLQSNGVGVAISPLTEDLYDGATPAPAGFDAVIHLDGGMVNRDMPLSGQQALVDYVAHGGRFIHAEWNAYEYSIGHLQAMRDLTVFDGVAYSPTTVTIEEWPVPGEESHPILAGLAVPLTFVGSFDPVTLHQFDSQPAQALMVDAEGNPGVAVRSFGAGTVVGFHFAAYGADLHTLGDPSVERLYLNAVLWQAQAQPPSIALNGDADMTVAWSTPFADPGATASDPVDGDLTAAIVVTGTVDTRTLGTYALSYSVTDRAGLTATVSRTVRVADLTPPVITLAGASPLPWAMNAAFVDPGATAYDAHDGDITARLSVSGAVDVAHPGTYTLTYTAADLSGNVATARRDVTVYAPPMVACSVARASLPWTGGLADVGLAWSARSPRPIVSVTCSVTQDEALTAAASPAHDAELSFASDGTPAQLLLRCARLANHDGRVYLVIITATDDLGQRARGLCTVVVPKGGGQKNLDSVQSQAASDLQAGAPLPVDSFGVPAANG